jgi:hypothetical protein
MDTMGALGWLTLASSVLLCGLIWFSLGWLLLRYVPLHGAMLSGLGGAIPFAARVTIGVSFWSIRLLPVAVVLCVPVAAAVAAVLFHFRRSWVRLARAGSATAILLSLLGTLGCGFVLVSIHAVYRAAAIDPIVQVNPRAFQEFREHRSESATPR